MIVFLFILGSLAMANTGELFAEMMGAPSRKATNRASYEMEWTDRRSFRGGTGSLRPLQQKFDLSVPDESQENRKWRYGLTLEYNDWSTSTRLPNGRPLPRSLWRGEVSVSHQRNLLDDRKLGVAFSLGSASDRPFSAAQDMFFQNTIAYHVPGDGESAWIFLLTTSNNRGFLNWIPLPGVIYSFRASSNLRMGIGLPFFTAFWTPIQKLVINVSYFPLYNAQFRAAYFLFGPAHIFLQAKQEQQVFALRDRTASKERLFHQRVIGEAGVVMPIERRIMLEANGGLAFERKIFLGETSSAYRKDDTPIRLLEKGPYASLKLTALF